MTRIIPLVLTQCTLYTLALYLLSNQFVFFLWSSKSLPYYQIQTVMWRHCFSRHERKEYKLKSCRLSWWKQNGIICQENSQRVLLQEWPQWPWAAGLQCPTRWHVALYCNYNYFMFSISHRYFNSTVELVARWLNASFVCPTRSWNMYDCFTIVILVTFKLCTDWVGRWYVLHWATSWVTQKAF